jgi:hypothetical protein
LLAACSATDGQSSDIVDEDTAIYDHNSDLDSTGDPESTGDPDIGADEGTLLDADAPTDIGYQLPFHIERKAEGVPLTEVDITTTTESILSLWKSTSYFQWILDTSHGMATGNEWGYPDYKLWWQDTTAVKVGDTVTFKHVGGGDNNLLRHARVLLYALAGHMVTDHPKLKEISIQYLRGIQAMYTSMVWGNEDPPIDTIMARAIYNHNHAYVASGGRKAEVDYLPSWHQELERRHDILNNPDNPYFGNIWVRSKRSNDDLPFLYRLVPVLMRVLKNDRDPEVVAEATKTLDFVRGFCRDIVDHEYRIRTRGPDGLPYEPFADGAPEDFASYTTYDWLDPNAECNAKLASALIAYKEPLGNDCLDGYGGLYEEAATASKYWGTPIIYYFHIAALAQALADGYNDAARALAAGLERRANVYMNDQATRKTVATWDGDAATFFITAASYGFPLTAREARLVSGELQRASIHYSQYSMWDLWAESVKDGEYDYLPGDRVSSEVIDGQSAVFQPAEIAAVMEYCESPYRDPSSSPFVDCDALFDTQKW